MVEVLKAAEPAKPAMFIGSGNRAAPVVTDSASLAPLAHALYQMRRVRDLRFPKGLFCEPAWDILLDLFAAHGESRQISVSSACIGASVPVSTALRWLAKLEERGLVARCPAQGDGRMFWIHLTEEGVELTARTLLGATAALTKALPEIARGTVRNS